MEGRLMISKPNENNSINVSNLSSGIYLLEMVLKDHSKEIRKIVKQ